MRVRSCVGVALGLIAWVCCGGVKWGESLQFELGKEEEECFSHRAESDGDAVLFSFVVIKTDGPWDDEHSNVDVVVTGPNFHREMPNALADKMDFIAHKQGFYKFCFKNTSPYHETIDFDIHIGHIPYVEEHAQDDHFDPLMTKIARLEEAIYTVQFEQHWLQAQTEQQAILNKNVNKRALQKAIFESTCLVGVSLLQVFLLKRLFERKAIDG